MFFDVPVTHWAYHAIRRLLKRGVVAGYPDGSYRPESPATRAELASALDKEYLSRLDLVARCQAVVVRVEALDENGAVRSIGSGVTLDRDGHIATNVHVVMPALDGGDVTKRLFVVLPDGTRLPARVPFGDGPCDCAVLKVTPHRLLAPAPVSVDRWTGEEVWAVGFPLELAYSVTRGIISHAARSVPAYNKKVTYIQTDAAINPGNSGGGLFNRYGELVGLPTWKFAKYGDLPVDNVSFALAAEEVLQVYRFALNNPATGVLRLDLLEDTVDLSLVVEDGRGE